MKHWIRRFLQRCFKVRYEQVGHLPEQAAVYIVNHLSFLDGIFLGAFLPHSPVFVIDRLMAQRWYFKIFLRYIPHVSVDPLHPMAIKQLVRIVREGQSILIFPEGRISTTGAFMKFYEGALYIAYKAQACVVPIYLSGLERTPLSRSAYLYRKSYFPEVRIVVNQSIQVTLPPTVEIALPKIKRQYLANLTREMMMETKVEHVKYKSLFEALLVAKTRFGKNRVIVEDINLKPENYQQLVRKSLVIGRLLSQHVPMDTRVGLLMPNSIGLVAAIYGLTAHKRTPALLNYTAGVEGIQAAAHIASVQLIVTSRKFLEKAKLTHLPEQLNDKTWVYAEDLARQLTLKDKLWVLCASHFPTRFLPTVTAEDEAAVLFTSGSEGLPKGVVHTHRSLQANVHQIHSMVDINSQDRFMLTLPMFHAFGLLTGAVLPVLSGSYTFYYPSPLHYRVIPEVSYDKRATILFGTNTFLANYAKYANPYDFTHLRFVVAGAEKLAETTRLLWQEKFGLRIFEGYGVTECAPVVALNVPMAYKAGSVGRLLPQMESKLLPIEGLAKGGRLVVRGPNVMKGYLRYENPAVLESPFHEGEAGWYDTGDIVDIDSEGFLFIQGRLKRFAKLAGEMVSLEVVEKLCYAVNADAQHVAAIRKDAQKGEAIVIFSTYPQLERTMLVQQAKQLGISELAIPRYIEYISDIPVLGSGKPDYVRLNEMANQMTV